MYGERDVIRARASQLREQGGEIRLVADQLVARADGISWSGRAAEAMRARIRDRAAQLRDVGDDHETAAESLTRHLGEIDRLKDTISATEARADSLVADARSRVTTLEGHDDPDGVRRRATPEDETLAAFTPPPPGHKDWLGVELPGL